MLDVAVLGGGLVGLAVAHALRRRAPHLSLAVIEKEGDVAQHQSGRNSGVLHAGIYYPPGSRKAALCTRGRLAMLAFCHEHGIAHRITGKLVIATAEAELPRLAALEEKARHNGVRVERLDARGILTIEPHARGIAALHVLDTGIADFRAVARTLVDELTRNGVEVRTSRRVDRVVEHADRVDLRSADETIEARCYVNCCGLFSDRIARDSGVADDLRIVPFRGEYHELRSAANHLVNTLIYPVPDPRFPFLGVHFTRDVHGVVECGPNAVLAFAREGYRRFDVSLRDTLETLAFPGFRRFAVNHLAYGLGELRRSWSRHAFAAAARRLVPALRDDDLVPAPAGVRAQALDRKGNLLSDFEIRTSRCGMHVLNAPSPAATASLAIGEQVATDFLERFPAR